MRVVVDTNVLLVSIGRQSPFRPIYDALLRQRLVLVVSTSILLEYEEILSQRNGPVVAQNVLDALENLRNVSRHEVRYNWRLPFPDPDDQKFVDAYVARQADYLVSNDRHFGELAAAGFPQVRVVSAAEFLEILARTCAYMSKRISSNREQLRKILKENEADPTLIAELKAVEEIINKPRQLAIPALIKFLTPDLQHSTKWFITLVFEKIRDERIIRPMMRAAIAPGNDGYRANFLWPLLKYDCTKHLKFFTDFIVMLPNPAEAMMVAVMIIREMKGPFEPAVARSCIRKLLAEVKTPTEGEWKLQTEAFRLEAADYIITKYFNQMRQAYWKPRNGGVSISKPH